MNLLERVLTLLRANLNSVVEKTDDPEKILRQLHIDMRNQLVQVKTQVATAIAESRKLQKRGQEKAAEAEAWLRKAEQAVQQRNDNAARAALIHYNEINKQVQRYKQLQKEQEQSVTTLRAALRQLEAKIAEVETTIDHLIARKRIALSQQQAFEHLNKVGSPKDKERTTKAQDAILEAEVRARTLADLHSHDIDTQLEQLSTEQTVEQQLQHLKARQPLSQEPSNLYEGNPRPSQLLQPQPKADKPAKQRITDELHLDEPTTDPPALKKLNLDLQKLLDALQQDTSTQD